MTPHNGRRPRGVSQALAGVAMLLCAAAIATWMISGTWGGNVEHPRVVVEAR